MSGEHFGGNILLFIILVLVSTNIFLTVFESIVLITKTQYKTFLMFTRQGENRVAQFNITYIYIYVIKPLLILTKCYPLLRVYKISFTNISLLPHKRTRSLLWVRKIIKHYNVAKLPKVK